MPQTPEQKEVSNVSEALHRASKYGVESEVVLYALKAMQGNPQLTVEQALEEGCREWDV